MKGGIEMKAFGSVVFLIVCLALCGLGCVGGGVRDNEPPRISGIETDPSTIIFSGRTVLVRAKVEDAGTGVKEVKLSVTYPDGQSQTLAMVSKGGGIYEVSFEAGWDARQMPTNFDQWVVQLEVEAKDGAGNLARQQAKVRAGISAPEPPKDF
jgi:hypothetical protein